MTTKNAPAADTARETLFLKMTLGAWDIQNSRVTKLLDTLTPEQLAAPTASGRNSGTYLIGHLVAVADGMLPVLGLGEKLYPQLESIFLTNPENPATETPSLEELKKYWHEVITTLSNYFKDISTEEWFSRHTAVSAEDFAKEPHRNKLNIVINRTNHTSYHLGQMVYLKPKQ